MSGESTGVFIVGGFMDDFGNFVAPYKLAQLEARHYFYRGELWR